MDRVFAVLGSGRLSGCRADCVFDEACLSGDRVRHSDAKSDLRDAA